jgi:hypothetical protein
MLLTKNKRIFLLLLILVCPVFVNLNIGSGLRFDANPFNYLGSPSLPMSLLFVLVLGLIKVTRLRMPLLVYFFLVASSIYLIGGALFEGGARSFILFMSMCVPILNYYIMREYLACADKNNSPISIIYNVLAVVIIFKFIADVSLYGSFYSEFFILKWVVIYSYYDYFPFLYFVSVLLAINCLFKGEKRLLSIVMLLICFVCIFSSHSRLYLVLSLFSVPMFIIFNIVKIRIYDAGIVSILFVMVATLYITLNGVEGADASFDERFQHWQKFVRVFDWADLFFPFSNEYRRSLTTGSFHNEYLEIFSYFGVTAFLYFFVLLKLFSSVDSKYRTIAITLLVSLTIGSLIQLNFTNPYVGIVWSIILAAMATKNKIENREVVRRVNEFSL